MATTTVGIKLDATVSGADQVKKLKAEIKAAEAEAKKISKEFGASSVEAQKAAEQVTKLAQGLNSFKSIKTQIREATQEAFAMSQKFGEFSTEALAAAKRVAGLKDTMQDFQQRVQALNPDKFEAIGKLVGGLASGVSAAQGAMALFGGESEELQKALLKVQGAMALSQGINGVIEARKQFVDFGKDAISAFKGMTTASKAFLATGIGLLVTAIAYVATNFDELAQSMGFAESEMQKMNKAMNMAAAETKQQAADLNYYNSIVQDTKKSEVERNGALEKLKAAGIATDDVNVANANSLQALNERVKMQIALIAQKARTEAAAQILQEKTKKLLEIENGNVEEQLSLFDKALILAKAGGNATLVQGQAAIKVSQIYQKTQQDVADATKVYNVEREKSLQIESRGIATSAQVKSTLEKQKEAQKELNKEHEKRTQKTLTREQQLFLNIRAGLQAGEKFDIEQKEKQAKRDQVFRQIRIDNALEDLEANKKRAEEEIELEKRKQDAIQAARLGGLQGAADAFNALSGLMKDGSDAQKAFALAGIAADSAKAISATIAEARNSAATMTAMGIPPPFPQIAAGGIYASGVAMVLNNVKRAKDILKGGNVSGGGGGGTGGAVPMAPSFTPTAGGVLPEEAQFGGMGRVYVLEGDITKTQTRVRRLRNTSVV
jgi:hypothetical protein